MRRSQFYPFEQLFKRNGMTSFFKQDDILYVLPLLFGRSGERNGSQRTCNAEIIYLFYYLSMSFASAHYAVFANASAFTFKLRLDKRKHPCSVFKNRRNGPENLCQRNKTYVYSNAVKLFGEHGFSKAARIEVIYDYHVAV